MSKYQILGVIMVKMAVRKWVRIHVIFWFVPQVFNFKHVIDLRAKSEDKQNFCVQSI